MGHGISHQTDMALLRDLLHDGGFADSRGSDQQNRALPGSRGGIHAGRIPVKVNLQGPLNLFFCLCNIHVRRFSYIYQSMSQWDRFFLRQS